MAAPYCGQPAVIMPMVSLLPLRARLHGDGAGGTVTSAHSPFAQGSPLSRMPGMTPPHHRRQQPFSTAATRDDGGNNSTGSSGGGGGGGGGGGNAGNGSKSRGSGGSRQGGRRQPLRMNNSDSQGQSGQAAQNGAADSQSARPGGWVNGSREQLQRRQQHQQQGSQAQRGSGQTLGNRGRGASRGGGKRGGPSMRLPDRPPRGSSADSSDSSEQLDEVLERYMGDNSGGGRARGRAPSQTAPRPSGGDGRQRQQRRQRTQWWQRAFAKQLGPEYERSYLGQPRKRLSKESWQKYVVGYLGRELREPENSEWRAAGVLVYTFDRSGELLMLLGRPDYSGSGLHSQRRNTWNLLGGKREAFDESANNTACREMWEESGGLLEEQHLMGQPDTVVWYPNGKYAVFPRQVQGQDDLPQRFAALKRRAKGAKGGPRPTLDLAWVPLTDILDPATSVRKHIFLKGLLKQPALLAWLLEVRASYRAASGLAATPAALPVPAKKPTAGAEVLRAGTAAEQQRQRQAAFLQEAEQAVAASLDEGDEGVASDDEADFDSIDSDSEDEEEQEFDEEEEEDEEAADADAAAAMVVEPAALAVDESRYGLATALPPGVAEALDAAAAEQRQQRRRLRGKAARQHWRQAVADAAVGPPTPIVGPVGWKPPVALPQLGGPGDVATALAWNIMGFKPGSWLAIAHQLIDADAGAMDLMDKHGVPRLDAEELYGINLLVDELKRGHVVWQLRHTLSLLGKGCPVGPALKDVLIIEAAKSDKGEGSDAVQAEAARLEAEAKELEEVLLWAKDNSSDPALMERGLRVLLRHALSDLLRGRVSPRALVPTTDRGLQELVVHVSELPDEELLTVLKVALTGVRRRRGIEGLPADDAQLKVDLVNELLVPPDALMHVLFRVIDDEAKARFEAARASLLQVERARNMAEALAMSRGNRAAKQHDNKYDQPPPWLVRRYREAIILAGASSDGVGSRARGMSAAQIDSLAERMAVDFLRSDKQEDPLGAMANPDTDVYDLDALRSSAETSEKMFPHAPDDWWVHSDPAKQEEKRKLAAKKRKGGGSSNGVSGGCGGSGGSTADSSEQQPSGDQQGGSWLQQIGGSLHHLVDSVSQAAATRIVDEVPAGVPLWDTKSELGRELERALLQEATTEHKKLVMRMFQSMVKLFERLTALGYSKHAVIDQLPFTALKQEHVRSTVMLQLRSVLSYMLPAMPLEPMREVLRQPEQSGSSSSEAFKYDVTEAGTASSSAGNGAGHGAASADQADRLLQAADAVGEPAAEEKKGFRGGMQQAIGGLVSGRPKEKPADSSTVSALLDPVNVVVELESMVGGSSGFSAAEDNAQLVARLGKLPAEMVRLALRAGLISQGHLLREFEVCEVPPLPPPDPPAEDAALLQGLLSLPPNWQDIVASLDSPDAQQQLLAKVKASDNSMGKRGQKGGRAAAAAKELAEFAEEAGQNDSGSSRKKAKGGKGARGNKSKGGGGGFGGKKR